MSDEDALRVHRRAIAITSTATLVGIAAAVASSAVVEGTDPSTVATSQTAQTVVLVAVVVQLPVYHLLFEEWGGAKDVLYVAFMTFIMWFVAWGLILSSGAQLV